MAGCNDLRLVLLGKTGGGKSSSGNLILGGKMFEKDGSSNSCTQKCASKPAQINGRTITVVDTPGFYDTHLSENELKPEVIRCITECAPGPHAFLIVIKVEKFTKQEIDVVKKIERSFGEEAFKHAVVLFTHGDQLDGNMTIEEFVEKNDHLRKFVERCGNRCHVIDNKYWNSNEQDEYGRNVVQVEALMKTIEQMVEKNGGGYYTNEMLQLVEEAKQAEKMKKGLEKKGKVSEEELEKESRDQTWKKLMKVFARVSTGAILIALCGGTLLAVAVSTGVVSVILLTKLILLIFAEVVILGALNGRLVGFSKAEKTKNASEAIEKTLLAIWGKIEDIAIKLSKC